MATDKHWEDSFGYAEKVVENWGEPPAYAAWIGGADGGGFFGIKEYIDQDRGIVFGYLANFSSRYEGMLLIVCNGKPIKLKDKTVIIPSGAIEASGQLVKLTNDVMQEAECDLMPIEREKFEYTDSNLGDKIIKKVPFDPIFDRNEVKLTSIYGDKYDYVIKKENKYLFYVRIADKFTICKLLNVVNDVDIESVSIISSGSEFRYLIFDNGSFCVLGKY